MAYERNGMAIVNSERAFIPIDGNGKITVKDLQDTIAGEVGLKAPIVEHTASGLPASDNVQEALQGLSARIRALETAA